MYTISFCRWQVKKPYGKENRRKKGVFTKEFATLNELARFLLTVRGALYCPKLRQEIGGRQNVNILVNKMSAIHDRVNNIVRCQKCGGRLNCEDMFSRCRVIGNLFRLN